MQRLHPPPAQDVSDAALVAAYAYPGAGRWVRANMVASVDGAATVDGRSAGLSSPADKRVFGLLRGLTDVVLVGAGTARTEGYRALTAKAPYAEERRAEGRPAAPTLALVTRSLDLDPESPLFHGGENRTVVVTSASSDSAARDRVSAVADVVVAGDEHVDLAGALAELGDRGLHRVLCEGGPSLLHAVVAAGLLDELCLTVVPVLAGDDAPRITAGSALDGPPRLALQSVLEDQGTLLLRYGRDSDAG